MGESTKVDYYLDTSPIEWELGGRYLLFDTIFPSSPRGIVKVIEIILCFVAMLLVASSQGVYEERNFALFVSFLGMAGSFTILVAYIFMLNTKLSQTGWFVMEAVFTVLMIALLLTASVCVAVFCAYYWSERNPVWRTVPSLAAGCLFVCMLLFFIDLILLVRYWKRYSWRPDADYSPRPLKPTSNNHSNAIPH